MANKIVIKSIAYGLSLVYGISFFNYLKLSLLYDVQVPALFVAILFACLFLSTLGVAWFQISAVRLLILLNIIACLYIAGFYIYYTHTFFVPFTYIVATIFLVLFFNQPGIKNFSQDVKKNLRKSILVVDDDTSLLKTIRQILISSGYSVLSATTGEKGLQIAKNQRPDLIILDVLLPGMKGREVCSKLKAEDRTRKIPVIFLTAKDSPDDVKAELAVGGLSHLTKPLNSKALLAEIKKTIG